MKRLFAALLLTLILALGVFLIASDRSAQWRGTDDAVVEHYAAKAGRPAREPFLNTDRGDLLLFLFLIAGAAGGFIFGYCFRGLFPPRTSGSVDRARNGEKISAGFSQGRNDV